MSIGLRFVTKTVSYPDLNGLSKPANSIDEIKAFRSVSISDIVSFPILFRSTLSFFRVVISFAKINSATEIRMSIAEKNFVFIVRLKIYGF